MDSREKFEALLDRLNAEKEKNKPEIEFYANAVNSLFGEIKGYLEKHIENGNVVIEKIEDGIFQNGVGDIPVPVLSLELIYDGGNYHRKIEIDPMGIETFGDLGTVVIKCDYGAPMFILHKHDKRYKTPYHWEVTPDWYNYWPKRVSEDSVDLVLVYALSGEFDEDKWSKLKR